MPSVVQLRSGTLDGNHLGYSIPDYLARDQGVGAQKKGARDGRLTREELEAARKDQFARYERSNDSYDRRLWNETGRMLQELDKNGAHTIEYLPPELRGIGEGLSEVEGNRLRYRCVELLEMGSKLQIYNVVEDLIDAARQKYAEQRAGGKIGTATQQRIESELDTISAHLNAYRTKHA